MRTVSTTGLTVDRYVVVVAAEGPEDLAAMFARVTRRLGKAEEPLLAASDLTMWEYVVLSRLARRPAPSQLTLAREISHDKTRLIGLLDGLQHRGLIDRAADPADRRSHTVAITDAGRDLHTRTQRAIRGMEDEILGVLSAVERQTLVTALAKLGSASA